MINLLMLMMSVPAIDYVETFKPGDLLDINQGYYVCEYPGDEALKRLMAIKNDVLRRKEAKELKCEFRDKKASEPYQIKSLDQSICLDPTSSFEYTINGTVPTMTCGREGHRMTITRGGSTKYVIWISMDVDYD